MSYNIGMNVVEVDGKGSPAIAGTAVSVGGFNITTERGIANKPIRVSSFTQFSTQFGGYIPSSLGAYMVKGFFDNGGKVAFINRIIDSSDATGHSAASLTLQNGSSQDTLTLTAGYRGNEDPGSWGNKLFAQVAASASASTRQYETDAATIESSAHTDNIDMSSLTSFSLQIDGEAVPTEISFQASDFSNAAEATLEQIVIAINRRTTKVIASISESNSLVLTSTGSVAILSGGFTSLQIPVAHAELGFSLMTDPVVGTAAALSAGGTRLARVADFQVGDAIQISDGTRTAHVKLLSIDESTNTVTWTPAIATPGSYDLDAIKVKNLEFSLSLARGAADSDHIVETWQGLSMEADLPNYVCNVLNDAIGGSKYCMAADEDLSVSAGLDIPAPLDFTALDGGRDGTPTALDYVGSQADHSGYYAFDALDIQLLTCERTGPAIISAGLGYCALRGDCMYVGAVPEGYVAAKEAVHYGKAFQGKNVYGALYGPWIKVLDPLGAGNAPYKFINPAGHIMGVYARIESIRGIWKAPAGDEASVMGALDVEHNLSDVDHTDLVKNGSVNGIRAVPGAGIVIDSSRTLSTDTRWLFVNVRLLFNYVKSSLKQGLRWVRQEPNRDLLWNAVKYNTINPFLMGLWRQGAFGTGSPEDVFSIVCDATNNPPDEVDKGNFKCEVSFYPSKPAETVIIVVGQQPSGASASEG